MIYGDKPEEGFFNKNTFIHKKLDFNFSFNKDFYFLNNPNYLLGITDKKTRIVFDIKKTEDQNNLKYLSKWTKVPQKKILNYKTEQINNFTISSGIIKKKNVLRTAIISNSSLFHRFVLISNKEEFDLFSDSFNEILYSFGKVSDNPLLSSVNPPKIKILRNLQEKISFPLSEKKLTYRKNTQKKYLK